MSIKYVLFISFWKQIKNDINLISAERFIKNDNIYDFGVKFLLFKRSESIFVIKNPLMAISAIV